MTPRAGRQPVTTLLDPLPRCLRTVLVAALLAGAVAASLTGPPAAAAELAVTTTADGGAGSLRAAFATASGNGEADEIVLAAGETYLLDDCAEGDLDHTEAQALTVTGNGATIEQTCDGERVIESGGDITLVGVTVTGGTGTNLGGGVESDVAGVSLVDSTVTGNTGGTGGGVAAIRVTLHDSTVSGNTADNGVGGGTAGGIWADQTILASNSTVTGNRALGAGGGLVVVNTSITLRHVTIAGNNAPTGANIQLQAGSDTLVTFASIFAAPGGGGANCAIDAGATTTSDGAGFNVATDASCGLSGASDVDAAPDPQLGALADNGGDTQTMLPAGTSPLLDVVDCAAAPAVPGQSLAADQRGVARPQGAACDVGAVEVEVPEPPGGSPSGPGGSPGGSSTDPVGPSSFPGGSPEGGGASPAGDAGLTFAG